MGNMRINEILEKVNNGDMTPEEALNLIKDANEDIFDFEEAEEKLKKGIETFSFVAKDITNKFVDSINESIEKSKQYTEHTDYTEKEDVVDANVEEKEYEGETQVVEFDEYINMIFENEGKSIEFKVPVEFAVNLLKTLNMSEEAAKGILDSKIAKKKTVRITVE